MNFLVPLLLAGVVGVRPGRAEPAGLDAREAVRRALSASPAVAAAEAEVRAAAASGVLSAEGDGVGLQGEVRWSDDRTDAAAPAIDGPFRKGSRLGVEVGRRWPSGTEFKTSIRSQRWEIPSAFRTVDPSVESLIELELRQPLIPRGKARLLRRIGRAGRSAREADRVRVREEEALGVLHALIGTVYAREKSARLTELNEAYDAFALELSSSVKSRWVSPGESAEALRRSERRHRRVNRAAMIQWAQEDELALRTGLESVEDLRLSTATLASLPSVPAMEDASPAEPAASSSVAVLEAEMALAERAGRPDLDLVASFGLAGLDGTFGSSLERLSSGPRRFATAGLAFRVPLSVRGRRLGREEAEARLEAERSRLEAASRSRRIARIEARWRRLSAEESVRDAEERRRKSRLRFERAEHRATTMEPREVYREEVRSHVMRELLDAEAERFEAELDILDRQREQELARVDQAAADGILLPWLEGP